MVLYIDDRMRYKSVAQSSLKWENGEYYEDNNFGGGQNKGGFFQGCD